MLERACREQRDRLAGRRVAPEQRDGAAYASAAATMKSIITPAELFYQEKGTANAVSVADLGTTSTANKLGVITSTTGTSGAVNLIFTFGSNSSINNDTLTFTRDPSTGWSCSQSTNVPEFDGCS